MVAVVVVILVLVLGSLAPRPEFVAASSHQGIEILSDQWEIHFPDAITFSLTIESDAPIKQVRLNYRNATDGPLAYSYAPFELGEPVQNVTASFRLSTTGSGYLPPGTVIQYRYVIDDVLGNRLETPSKAIEYTDIRFNWKSTEAGLVTLMHHDISQSRVDALAKELQPELYRVQRLLELNSNEPVTGFLYNGFDEAIPAFPYQSNTITEEQVFHGFAYPDSNVFLGIRLDRALIVHEASHLLLRQRLGPSSTTIPSWLDEGFASHMEPNSRPYSGISLAPTSPPLRLMSGVSGSPQDIYRFYAKSESVISYLIEKYGEESFQQFIASLSRSVAVEEALTITYGFNIDELDLLWSESSHGILSTGSERVSTGPPSVLLYLDTWLFGGLILLAVAAVAVRYVWGKLNPTMYNEDGWDDELDEVLEDYDERS